MTATHPEPGVFGEFVRPGLMEKLRALGLDVSYHRGTRDSLWYGKPGGEEVEILDLVGGFGSGLVGHNHPAVVARAHEVLDQSRPMHAQGSERVFAGTLGKRISQWIGRCTNQTYVVTLGNSGTEAVEAALKHAELERQHRATELLGRLERRLADIQRQVGEGAAVLSPDLLWDAAAMLRVSQFDDLPSLCRVMEQFARSTLGRPPVFLALEGAFHGKTIGAIQLTYNKEYRTPWEQLGPAVVFLPIDDVDAAARAVESATVTVPGLNTNARGQVVLDSWSFTNVAACIVEPIQGEGGMREIPTGFLETLRQAATECGYPLIFDEIQCGMGRTGTFLAAERTGVHADYYLLGKSLGGGLAKISALAVERERYIHQFGYLHTSTFADDDFSSAVALRTLDLLEDDELLRFCQEKGAFLLERLRALKSRYPGQLRDVRGRGLMIGVELVPQLQSRSPLLRVFSEQGLLGFLVSAYLLREERIRVMPPLSAANTIRIQPSAYISYEELQRAVDAVERVLGILRDHRAGDLCSSLVGRSVMDRRRAKGQGTKRRTPTENGRHHDSLATRVGFLTHFLEPGDLREWDPSLLTLRDAECERLLDRAARVVEPFVAGEATLRSRTGATTRATILGLPFTSKQICERLRCGDDSRVLELIRRGVDLAAELGFTVLGFGAYTSIITRNCQAIDERRVALTSGNSLTAAAAFDVLFQAAAELHLERQHLGVVGGAGNIGTVLAQLAAERVDRITLVGRPRAEARLRRTAAAIYGHVYRTGVPSNGAGTIGRLVHELTGRISLPAGTTADSATIGAMIRDRLEGELGANAPVRIATDIAALRDCNLVLAASNAPSPVVFPQHVSDAPVVICDVAVPGDVHEAVGTQRSNALVLQGGIIRAPLGQQVSIAGMSLPPGQLYGCLAETMLLGLAGITEHFSYGPLKPERVRQIGRLAREHGFIVEPKPAFR